MIVETIYHGRDNTFSLRLTRGGVAEQLMAINKYELVIVDLKVIDKQEAFTEKTDGIVEIDIGRDFIEEEVGSYRAHLVTYDPVNQSGVRWPDFKLKVK